jgi:hypothetical protein
VVDTIGALAGDNLVDISIKYNFNEGLLSVLVDLCVYSLLPCHMGLMKAHFLLKI